MDRHEHHNSEEKDVPKKMEAAKASSLRAESDQELQSGNQAASSPSSSPSHDFSFTISLHHHHHHHHHPPPSSFALDLSPADDIFFHGHLLPLHLLSHLPVSPRSSTTSIDSLSLPIKDNASSFITTTSSSSNKTTISMPSNNVNTSNSKQEAAGGKTTTSNSKSFSAFGLTRTRGCRVQEKEEDAGKEKQKRKLKLKLEVINVLKRYFRIFRGGRRRDEKIGVRGQTCSNSYSGNLSQRNKQDVVRGRRGEYSAPASMRTSPSNSGLLLATSTLPPPTDSTMEELQAAIQAAIAHCKNSIAKDDKLKC